MKDFSQNGEGKIIHEYFAGQTGALLDIGANDGITLSNSRGLVEAGWMAVLVEPAPKAFENLWRNSCKVSPIGGNLACGAAMVSSLKFHDTGGVDRWVGAINAAITTQDGPIDFWDCGVHLHKNDTSLLSTTKPETLARWKRSGEQFTKTTVRGITFATLLKETDSTHFDFVSIDAEGADYDILKQMDLAALGVKMLCVETNGNDAPFIEYATKHGMKLHRKVVENLIFVRT